MARSRAEQLDEVMPFLEVGIRIKRSEKLNQGVDSVEYAKKSAPDEKNRPLYDLQEVVESVPPMQYLVSRLREIGNTSISTLDLGITLDNCGHYIEESRRELQGGAMLSEKEKEEMEKKISKFEESVRLVQGLKEQASSISTKAPDGSKLPSAKRDEIRAKRRKIHFQAAGVLFASTNEYADSIEELASREYKKALMGRLEDMIPDNVGGLSIIVPREFSKTRERLKQIAQELENAEPRAGESLKKKIEEIANVIVSSTSQELQEKRQLIEQGELYTIPLSRDDLTPERVELAKSGFLQRGEHAVLAEHIRETGLLEKMNEVKRLAVGLAADFDLKEEDLKKLSDIGKELEEKIKEELGKEQGIIDRYKDDVQQEMLKLMIGRLTGSLKKAQSDLEVIAQKYVQSDRNRNNEEIGKKMEALMEGIRELERKPDNHNLLEKAVIAAQGVARVAKPSKEPSKLQVDEAQKESSKNVDRVLEVDEVEAEPEYITGLKNDNGRNASSLWDKLKALLGKIRDFFKGEKGLKDFEDMAREAEESVDRMEGSRKARFTADVPKRGGFVESVTKGRESHNSSRSMKI